ncbi:replication initiation protein [Larsenimonas salina]|uniref:replication initiation protein n=1 Tax=Larsenimonas salina TaxID=1295565 RepID=UPI0020748F18|nr:replication initiation protein [Larsenimonas salina]MCM5705829.1 replication initiation protein [Larsenimonas salina]
MNEPQVYKSNALVEASYRLTPAEQRIMLGCITQVRRDQPLTDEIMYSVSVADYAALVGTDSHSTYKELADAALRLKRREVWLREYPNGQGKRPKTLVTSWVQSIAYVESEGRVELRFTRDMLPYLTQLTEQFTRYALEDVAKMTSAHAMRLYELLCQWRGAGERKVSIEWLREAFQLNDKYPAIKDLKRWVIEPAAAQINEHSPLWVKWDQRKEGRRVSHLVFYFGEKSLDESQKIGRKKNKAREASSAPGSIFRIPMTVIEANARPGESHEDVALRILEERKSAVED